MTITEVDLAALVSLDAEAPKALHFVCWACYPPPQATVPALCGYMTTEDVLAPQGERKCSKCLELHRLPVLPCGH